LQILIFPTETMKSLGEYWRHIVSQVEHTNRTRNTYIWQCV